MSISAEEMFKNAPKEATHYCEGAMSGLWRDLSGYTWKFYRESYGTWHDSASKTSSLLHNNCGLTLIERPKPKQWSGPEDGLPPVGVEFEWRYGDMEWKKGEALYIGKIYVILKSIHGDEQHYYLREMKFRAITTPDQKRETAIRELMDIAQVDCRVTAARLVDAGFKREVV